MELLFYRAKGSWEQREGRGREGRGGEEPRSTRGKGHIPHTHPPRPLQGCVLGPKFPLQVGCEADEEAEEQLEDVRKIKGGWGERFGLFGLGFFFPEGANIFPGPAPALPGSCWPTIRDSRAAAGFNAAGLSWLLAATEEETLLCDDKHRGEPRNAGPRACSAAGTPGSRGLGGSGCSSVGTWSPGWVAAACC